MHLESDFAEINVNPHLCEVLDSQRVSWLVSLMSQDLFFHQLKFFIKVFELIFAANAEVI